MDILTFSLRADPVIVSNDLALQIGVHVRNGSGRTFSLELANILGSEQELSVQVTLFNGVKVGNMNDTVGTSGETHHAPIFQHLTTDSTRTDKELASVGNLFLEGRTEDGDLPIVSRSKRLDVSLGRKASGERLE